MKGGEDKRRNCAIAQRSSRPKNDCIYKTHLQPLHAQRLQQHGSGPIVAASGTQPRLISPQPQPTGDRGETATLHRLRWHKRDACATAAALHDGCPLHGTRLCMMCLSDLDWVVVAAAERHGCSVSKRGGSSTSHVTSHTPHLPYDTAGCGPTAHGPPNHMRIRRAAKNGAISCCRIRERDDGCDCGRGLRGRDLRLGWGLRLELMLGVWRMSVYLKVYAPCEVPVPLLAAAEARRGNCVANYTVAQVAAAALF